MKNGTKTISVFGSSRPKENDPEYREAYTLGALLAKAGYTVCNGGYAGTMEASSHGAKDGGGKTIGIVSEFFSPHPNRFIDETILTTTLIERLIKLIEIADAYIILKGGTGTLLELAAVWEFKNKRIMVNKPIIVIGNFWPPVIHRFNHELVYKGNGDTTQYITVVDNPEDCVSTLDSMFINNQVERETNI